MQSEILSLNIIVLRLKNPGSTKSGVLLPLQLGQVRHQQSESHDNQTHKDGKSTGSENADPPADPRNKHEYDSKMVVCIDTSNYVTSLGCHPMSDDIIAGTIENLVAYIRL